MTIKCTYPLFFVTGNKNKFSEAKKIIPEIKQINIDLPEIQEINPEKVIETKLLEALKYEQARFIVEDTSLYLNCLNGLPGPLIKWFMKTMGNEGLFNLTQKLNDEKAKAQTIIGYIKNKNDIHYFKGTLDGKIVSPRGTHGFGWDSIFQPNNSQKTLAELTQEEKNKISMRRKAFNKLKNFLKENDT